MTYKRDSENRLLLTDKQASDLYIDYFNNYLTVKRFSEDLGTSVQDAENIIERGRIVFNRGK